MKSQRWAVATVSLGKHASHTLERKLSAAAKDGFEGIELFYNDLVDHAKQNNVTPPESATRIRALCKELQLTVVSLSPLKNFEGNLTIPWSERLDTARYWVELAAAVGAAYVQVPAQFLNESTGSEAVVIPELQALADLAAGSSVGIAYEAVAWARFQPTWQEALQTIELVDRSNFKLCMDSFHVHARLWGDVRAAGGRIQGGDEAVTDSLAEFVATCPKERVAYLQLSDGSRFDPPLEDDSPLFNGLEVHDARLVWSRIGRPFPLEAPGYLPVMQVAQSWLVDYDWVGWVSLEGFLDETTQESHGPEAMAARARQSKDKVQQGLTGKYS
ncbi:xylose isomerase-like TIM barrel domain-containing protein [Sarocladium implicatum]|nr:xylose isomerase-like TIM barrel domain-containing protein [Sarocladium implicatum]